MEHQRERTRKRNVGLMYENLPVPEQEDVASMRRIIDFMLSLPENKEKEIVPVGLIGGSPDYELLFKVGKHYRKEFAEILFETIDSTIPFCILSFKRRKNVPHPPQGHLH